MHRLESNYLNQNLLEKAAAHKSFIKFDDKLKISPSTKFHKIQ